MALSLVASAATNDTSEYFELGLKTMAPRVSRYQLSRSRLSLGDERFSEHSVIVVQAPAGFGKTSLLGQWRREYLTRGVAVAWVTADSSDDPRQLLHCLVRAVRSSCGRRGFGRLLLEGSGAKYGDLEGVTAWLAEVARTPLELILIVDEAERLSPVSFSSLVYLLHNTPSNLRVIVGARSGLDVAVADLLNYGRGLALGPKDLRFHLDETVTLLHNRFGEKADPNAAAYLHEATEGWPLGLQVVMAAMERTNDPLAAIASVSEGFGGRNEKLVGGLLTNLASVDADFLVRISVVDLIHPDLCRALTGLNDAPERLARLFRDTPVFIGVDGTEWVRLHNLVRDAFRARLAKLPDAERVELHVRALDWLVEHGMLQEAAHHAHATGRHEIAYDLAEQFLYDAVAQGHQEKGLGWLELLPKAELKRRPRLRLATAWTLALSERYAEAENLVQDLLENANTDPALHFECALIIGGAAYYADDPDRCLAHLEPWIESFPLRDPRLVQLHANRQALLAILTGNPGHARRYIPMVSGTESYKSYRYVRWWGNFITGLSYLWEGHIVLAEDVLRPALEGIEAGLGRRHPLACMIASLLATSVYEQNRLDEAAELLANRLDVLERAGTPETVLLAYKTAARIAAAKGIEHSSLDLLEVMYAVGVARGLPRLCVASLGEQIRMHAGRFRAETCRALVVRVDDIIAANQLSKGPLWRQAMQIPQWLAHANAAIAAQDWQSAFDALTLTGSFAEGLKLGRWRIEIMALRAFALERMGEKEPALLREAINLAQTFSLSRVFVDTHPVLGNWVQRVVSEDGGPQAPMPRVMRTPFQCTPSPPLAVPSLVLTPKEREVLRHLARNLSNKEIAQAMEVAEETVKWHLKNLFGKLEAGTRRHVVRRAQFLGLLALSDDKNAQGTALTVPSH
jgi:LuxR family transcriptional regulator, maltose regulon positive regulatory protein